MLKAIQYLWALPATALGIVLASLALISGGRIQCVAGAIEAYGGLVTLILRRGMPWLANGASAIALGHVILGRDQECLAHSRRHEHVHIRQYERWGPLMLPLYTAASVLCWWRGQDPYLDNPFEVEAYNQAP
jgi:hypothetical protein